MLPLIVLAASLAGLVCGGLLLFLQRNGNSTSGIAGNGGSARVETDSETGTGTRLPAWRDTPIAFGPYLAAAGWAALCWGQPLRAGYWGWFAL